MYTVNNGVSPGYLLKIFLRLHFLFKIQVVADRPDWQK